MNKTTAWTSLTSPSLYGGRFSRKQFWFYTLIGNAVFAALYVLPISSILFLLLAIPYVLFYQLPISVKRTHDANEAMTLALVVTIAQLLGIVLALFSYVFSFLDSFALMLGLINVPLAFVYLICMGFGARYPKDNEYGVYKN